MPTVREQLTTQVIELLEGSAAVTALFRAANKANTLTKPGWLRDMVASAPADFRRFSLDFTRGSHSMWTRADGNSFAADDPTFHSMTNVDFELVRSFVLGITVREELPASGISAPEEA